MRGDLRRRPAPRLLLGLAVLAALSGPSCLDAIEDIPENLQTCHLRPVELANSMQTTFTVQVIGPDESFTEESRLAPGQTRRLTLCLQNGTRELFRAAHDGELIGEVRCVAFHSSEYYDIHVPQALWTPLGFACNGW